jgi:Phage late-transcription coactivator
MTPNNFALKVEQVVKEQKLDYLDAACQVCEEFEIELASVSKLISPTMRDKIEMDARLRKYRI